MWSKSDSRIVSSKSATVQPTPGKLAPRNPSLNSPTPGKHSPAPLTPRLKEKMKTQTTNELRKSKESSSAPEKSTTGQRARRVAVALVLWVLVPVLTLSMIFVTIWSHDLELEDCQEDHPVNCPLNCPDPRPLVWDPEWRYRNKSAPPPAMAPAEPCWRDQGRYVVPVLGIMVAWPEALLVYYMIFLIISYARQVNLNP